MKRLLLMLVLTACTTKEPPPSSSPWENPAPTQELEAGRTVWLDNCKRCHGSGKAGSPRLGDHQAWKPRMDKGHDVLLQHALSGFEGPTGTEMPARGGNPDLTDDQVQLALGYMLSLARSDTSPSH